MFADNLKKARAKAGLTQKELAKRLYMSQQAVAKWETGASSPNPEMISRLAAALDINTSELLGESTKKEPSGEEGLSESKKELLRIWDASDESQQKYLLDLIKMVHDREKK